MVKRFFTKAESKQPLVCCWAWPYLPGPLLRVVTGEDAHGDHGCQMLFPRCRRMIGFMDLDSALWQRRGRLCHTWEKKTLAGCEMLLNKVIPRVILRPVTHFPRHRGFIAWPRATYGEYCVWIDPLFEMGVRLCLCLPLCEVVVKLQTTMSWLEKKRKKNIQAKISKGTIQTADVSVLTLNNLMSLKCNRSFWLLRDCVKINL